MKCQLIVDRLSGELCGQEAIVLIGNRNADVAVCQEHKEVLSKHIDSGIYLVKSHILSEE